MELSGVGDVGANRAEVDSPTGPNEGVEPTPRNGAAHAERWAAGSTTAARFIAA